MLHWRRSLALRLTALGDNWDTVSARSHRPTSQYATRYTLDSLYRLSIIYISSSVSFLHTQLVNCLWNKLGSMCGLGKTNSSLNRSRVGVHHDGHRERAAAVAGRAASLAPVLFAHSLPVYL